MEILSVYICCDCVGYRNIVLIELI